MTLTPSTRKTAAALTASFARAVRPPRPSPYMVNRSPAATSFPCTVWEMKILRRALKNAMSMKSGGSCPEFKTLSNRINAILETK